LISEEEASKLVCFVIIKLFVSCVQASSSQVKYLAIDKFEPFTRN
jgi:hypothetical protein